MKLAWDFHEKAWDAEFTAGPYIEMTRRVKVTDLGRHWGELRQLHLSVGYMHSNHFVQQKAVAKEVITHWCAAITREEGGSFESRWGLRRADDGDTAVAAGTNADSPMHQGRVVDDDTAVADELDEGALLAVPNDD